MLKNVKKNHTDFYIFIAYCGQGFFGKTDKKTFDNGALIRPPSTDGGLLLT